LGYSLYIQTYVMHYEERIQLLQFTLILVISPIILIPYKKNEYELSCDNEIDR